MTSLTVRIRCNTTGCCDFNLTYEYVSKVRADVGMESKGSFFDYLRSLITNVPLGGMLILAGYRNTRPYVFLEIEGVLKIRVFFIVLVLQLVVRWGDVGAL